MKELVREGGLGGRGRCVWKEVRLALGGCCAASGLDGDGRNPGRCLGLACGALLVLTLLGATSGLRNRGRSV